MQRIATADRGPPGRRVLQAANTQKRRCVLELLRTTETAVRQETVVPEIDSKHAKDINANNSDNHYRSAKNPWKKGQQSDQVIAYHRDRLAPAISARVHLGRKRQPSGRPENT